MRAFVNHFRFEFATGLRNPIALLMYYLFPLGFYLLMGVVMVQINPDFAELLIPAMIAVTLMAGTLLGLPAQLVDAREAGIYRSFKVNGVPAASILVIPMIAAAIHGVIASTIIASTAGPMFGATAPTNWRNLVSIIMLSAFAFGAIAALIGVVSANSRATVLWSQLVFLPSMLISGLMFDLSLIPDGVQLFSRLLPTTYVMQAFAGHAFGVDTVIDPTSSVVVLAAGGLLALALAVGLFSWDRQNLTRRLHPALSLIALAPYLIAAIAG